MADQKLHPQLSGRPVASLLNKVLYTILLDILASGNLNPGNVETGVPEHGNRLDWLNGYLSGTTHLSSPEPLCGAKQALQLS